MKQTLLEVRKPNEGTVQTPLLYLWANALVINCGFVKDMYEQMFRAGCSFFPSKQQKCICNSKQLPFQTSQLDVYAMTVLVSTLTVIYKEETSQVFVIIDVRCHSSRSTPSGNLSSAVLCVCWYSILASTAFTGHFGKDS